MSTMVIEPRSMVRTTSAHRRVTAAPHVTVAPRPLASVRPVAQPARVETRPATPSLHLTSRGRGLVAVLALLVAAGIILFGSRATAEDAPRALEVEYYTVAAGETLWSIAAGIADPGQDVRDVIDELTDLNRLDTASLQAGQQILVPAESF